MPSYVVPFLKCSPPCAFSLLIFQLVLTVFDTCIIVYVSCFLTNPHSFWDVFFHMFQLHPSLGAYWVPQVHPNYGPGDGDFAPPKNGLISVAGIEIIEM